MFKKAWGIFYTRIILLDISLILCRVSQSVLLTKNGDANAHLNVLKIERSWTRSCRMAEFGGTEASAARSPVVSFERQLSTALPTNQTVLVKE